MKIAVIGAGVSGLSSTWALNEYSCHEVHLFEPLAWIGGHANTVSFTPPTCASSLSAPSTPVDTGFIVFNQDTYPNFLAFLKLAGIAILNSDMSFSVSRYLGGYGAFEWAGGSVGALFCQTSNLFNPAHWRMVWDIIRFNQQSLDYLRTCHQSEKQGRGGKREESIGEWLDQRNYSPSFRKNYLIPMTASIWSTAPETALSSFPALTLLRFMHNHHLLQILNRPQWLTVKNASHSYVQRIMSKLPQARLHQGRQKGQVVAAWVDAKTAKWTIKTADRKQQKGWDRVIFASHADQTMQILTQGYALGNGGEGEALKEAVGLLANFAFSQNSAVLHSDVRLMPKRRHAWSAWDFLAETVTSSASTGAAICNETAKEGRKQVANSSDVDRVSLTYYMNLLQSLPESKFGPILVTLNPTTDPCSPYTPRRELVLKHQAYTHPIYTRHSVAAQRQLGNLQGVQGAYFAGAWTNYGFHEDGFSSGLKAAERIEGVYLPFEIRDAERHLPRQKQWQCTLVESVDALGRGPVVRRLTAVVCWLVVYLLAVLQMILMITGVSRHVWMGVGRVKGYWRHSLRGLDGGETKEIKAN
ncbi:hypothetical protein NDA10_003251 [Ustilago hordei]|uniref:Amine oxidase domain-containing protein n=1 Tax=Ustilago hordei TaxID=120017 RepID=I2FQL8_USTHO|nr:uncharacterized protein UHO2_05219 [Ustilago hordei]KAJ1042908.1 hypothetical protein NDA10_003251 [Ustilago hordei]CCF49211.1 uncharacterized protein UHOR_07593 [Ustilago hordei]SYW80039.1 uncharacterized protein UHO2_05219 [Ustilago hordei]